MHATQGSTRCNFWKVTSGAAIAAAFLSLSAIPGYAATTTVHSAFAYGAEVNVGTAVKIGKVAVAELPPCSVEDIGTYPASAASVSYNGLVGTGLVDDSATNTATSSTAVSDVFGVNLLNGLISSTEIKAVSTSSIATNGTYQFSTAGSTIGNLTVLGIRIALDVAPNTVISLPLLGSVTLNEQVSYVSNDEAELTVNMIHVRLNLGANAGTEIIIASAQSEIKSQNVAAVVGGYAYAPQLTAGKLSSGPLALELIPCFGTSGAVKTDAVAAVAIPGVVSTGAVTVTGEGSLAKGNINSQATTSIAGINLLTGLVSASAITGKATALTTDGVNFQFSGGSTFVGLVVTGHPEITVDVKLNTAIPLAGLGTLYFNRVEHFADKIKVVPIELVINTTNTLGLPIGADLTLGAAEAQLHNSNIP